MRTKLKYWQGSVFDQFGRVRDCRKEEHRKQEVGNTKIKIKIKTHFRLLNVPLAFINNHMIKHHHTSKTILLLVLHSSPDRLFHSFRNKKTSSVDSNTSMKRYSNSQNRNYHQSWLLNILNLIRGLEKKDIFFGLIVNKMKQTYTYTHICTHTKTILLFEPKNM